MMHIFHNWSKWEQYKRLDPERMLSKNWVLRAMIEVRQKRRCLTCGKAQDKLVTSYPADSI